MAEVEIGRSRNWPKSKLAEVEIGRNGIGRTRKKKLAEVDRARLACHVGRKSPRRRVKWRVSSQSGRQRQHTHKHKECYGSPAKKIFNWTQTQILAKCGRDPGTLGQAPWLPRVVRDSSHALVAREVTRVQHRCGKSGAACREESDGFPQSRSRATSDRAGGEIRRCWKTIKKLPTRVCWGYEMIFEVRQILLQETIVEMPRLQISKDRLPKRLGSWVPS